MLSIAENLSSNNKFTNKIQWIPMVNRKMLSEIELEDYTVTFGGIDHDGETAEEFCDSVYDPYDSWNISNIIPLKTLNEGLKECGIKPLSLFRLIKKFGRRNLLSTVIYGVDDDDNTLEQVIISQDSYLKLMRETCEEFDDPRLMNDVDLLKNLKTFTAFDVDLLLVNTYVAAEVSRNTELLDSINIYKEIDVLPIKDGFSNSVKAVVDPLTDSVAKQSLNSKDISEYKNSDAMSFYFKKCLGIK